MPCIDDMHDFVVMICNANALMICNAPFHYTLIAVCLRQLYINLILLSEKSPKFKAWVHRALHSAMKPEIQSAPIRKLLSEKKLEIQGVGSPRTPQCNKTRNSRRKGLKPKALTKR